jgi:RsiW-degrading membrane proteinase PrsW (M82 family)
MAGLIVFLTTGLKAELDLKDRSAPNQGIKNSCKNMLTLTTIFVIVIVSYRLLVLVPVFSQKNGPEHIPLFLLIASIYLFLLMGGWALIQHFSLRIVLAINGYAPYRFDNFLNYCVERRLLYPIGGRYIFLHRELLDHFDPSKR